MLGEWPYVCVAICQATDEHGTDVYGVAVWESGDVTARGYTDRLARNRDAAKFADMMD
jgi:hypothetical protein